MSIKLLSMDTSSSATGITIFLDSKFQGYSLLETDKKIKGEEKLNQMIKLIYNYLDKEHPDIVCSELTAVTRNPSVQRMLTEILGAIRGKCLDKSIDYYAFRPTEWRKTIEQITGIKPKSRKREDLKQWSLDVVNNYFGIETDSNDISDSILIGKHYIEIFS